MPHFFAPIIDNAAVLDGEDAEHLSRALRARPGDSITVADGGTVYDCVIEALSRGRAEARVVGRRERSPECAAAVHLFACLPKADKLEQIIQKAVELGAHSVTPVESAFCVSRWDRAKEPSKLQRYRKIALAAAKQSGRAVVPEVRPCLSLCDAAAAMAESDLALFCYERATEPLRAALEAAPAAKRIALLCGSEGGFSEQEAALVTSRGARAVSLGARILRCETAPLAALSAIYYHAGDLG